MLNEDVLIDELIHDTQASVENKHLFLCNLEHIPICMVNLVRGSMDLFWKLGNIKRNHLIITISLWINKNSTFLLSLYILEKKHFIHLTLVNKLQIKQRSVGFSGMAFQDVREY